MEEASRDAVEVEVRAEEVPLPASTLWVSNAGSEPEEVVTFYNMIDIETPEEAPEREKVQSVETYSIREETPLNKNSSMGEITESKVEHNYKLSQEDQMETVSLLTTTDSNINPCEVHSSSQNGLKH